MTPARTGCMTRPTARALAIVALLLVAVVVALLSLPRSGSAPRDWAKSRGLETGSPKPDQPVNAIPRDVAPAPPR